MFKLKHRIDAIVAVCQSETRREGDDHNHRFDRTGCGGCGRLKRQETSVSLPDWETELAKSEATATVPPSPPEFHSEMSAPGTADIVVVIVLPRAANACVAGVDV